MPRIERNLCIALAVLGWSFGGAWAQLKPPQAAPGPAHALNLAPALQPGLHLAPPPTSANTPVLTLTEVFDAAWQRQPEARSLQARQEAAAARKEAAASWTAEPVALELSGQTDQMNNNLGRREYTAGVAVPLWLPNERARSMAVAEAEQRATASSTLLAQLQTAAEVREAYWSWQSARIGFVLARERLLNAQQLTADVSRRVRAGDLARADQHQAEGAQAGAEAELAEASSALAAAAQRLRALSGLTLPADITAQSEALPAEPAPERVQDAAALGDRHPAVIEWLNRAEIARKAAELAQARTRATPELILATSRDRGAFGENYQQSVTVGVRFPFGSDSRNRASIASAQAQAIEAETQLTLERDRIQAALDSAQVRLESARTQLTAAERRAQLARESRAFFEKSFRAGETDLPTRLRIELEAIAAERQAARSRVELATAISALRQAQGLLPQQSPQ
ncbi:TolC family protein [Curvibacter sp. PAE-UM]|uniref:TolC family protein n=1 Tax=Curvibacter sp. PAE-UM TaxID=1714344 RepID=UPI0009E70896|nr:TolC family protein [Curvibacter sp. PAE-UM]